MALMFEDTAVEYSIEIGGNEQCQVFPMQLRSYARTASSGMQYLSCVTVEVLEQKVF